MATKRIKFIKAWNMTPVGAVMELDAPIADLLIKNGRAIDLGDPVPDLVAPENVHYASKYGALPKGKAKKLGRKHANR